MKILIACLTLALFTTGCTLVQVEPGKEAVLIQKPLIFGHGGVVKQPVLPGSTITALTTSAYQVDMIPLIFEEVFDDIMPKDNNPVDYHASVRLQITNSVQIIEKFGEKWYDNNIKRAFQTMNRNQVRNYSMPELALQQVVVSKIENELENELQEYIKNNKIPVRVINVSLGKISPQKEIISAYNETGVQQQRAKTEAQRANAEESRKLAEQKRAEADRAYQESRGLNTDQYLRMLQIEACKSANCTLILGANPTPILNMK